MTNRARDLVSSLWEMREQGGEVPRQRFGKTIGWVSGSQPQVDRSYCVLTHTLHLCCSPGKNENTGQKNAWQWSAPNHSTQLDSCLELHAHFKPSYTLFLLFNNHLTMNSLEPRKWHKELTKNVWSLPHAAVTLGNNKERSNHICRKADIY